MISKLLQRLSDAILAITAVLLIAMVSLVLIQILSRYILKTPVAQTEELARYAMVWSALLGAAVGIRNKSHVAVTFIVSKFPKVVQKVSTMVVYLCVLVFCGLLVWQGGALTQKAMMQVSTTMPLKMGYIIVAIPLCGMFGFIFTLENIAKEFVVQKEVG